MSSLNPYEPPPIPEPQSLGERRAFGDDKRHVPPFRSPRELGVLCMVIQGIGILETLLAAYWEYRRYTLQPESMPEEERNLDAIDTLTSWQSTNDLVSLPLALLSITLLIAWTYRCHRNLESLGHRELDCKHIWAIICWFIPVLHLFCPYQVMREIWWRSNPDSQPVPKFSPATHLVASWGLIRASAKIAAVLESVFGSYETYPQYYTYLRITSVFRICDVISSVLCILIVQRITHWQVVRYQRLHESAAGQ